MGFGFVSGFYGDVGAGWTPGFDVLFGWYGDRVFCFYWCWPGAGFVRLLRYYGCSFDWCCRVYCLRLFVVVGIEIGFVGMGVVGVEFGLGRSCLSSVFETAGCLECVRVQVLVRVIMFVWLLNSLLLL